MVTKIANVVGREIEQEILESAYQSDQPEFTTLTTFVINKQYANKLRDKVNVFKKVTRTNKQIFVDIISANDIKKNIYSEDMVDKVVTLSHLFSKEE